MGWGGGGLRDARENLAWLVGWLVGRVVARQNLNRFVLAGWRTPARALVRISKKKEKTV